MVYLSDFISVYDNNITTEECESLIYFFEELQDNNELILTDVFTLSEEISTLHQKLIQNVVNIRDEYYNFFCKRIFPETHAFEKFKISKVEPTEETNLDATLDVFDYSSARRFLSFTWYLNNNNGSTEFLDLEITPSPGKLIVYPPFWMFPHKDNHSTELPKYIMTTYLHYK